MNIKALTMRDIKGLDHFWYKSSKDHSKWMITDNSSTPWTCIGDINHAVSGLKLFLSKDSKSKCIHFFF